MIKSGCALNLLPSHGDEKAVGVTSERPVEAASEPAMTVPENCMVTVNGLEPEAANDLGQNVATIMRVLSSKFDLSGLDGVTIAHDYHGALAALDRGREGLRPLRATHAEHSVGVAMSPIVIRDGAIKTHIVLPLWLMEHVTRPETEEFRTVLQVLAHECGHVAEHAAFDRALPLVLLHRTIPSLYDQIVWEVAEACWSEYAASCMAAGFGSDPLEGYIETLQRSSGTVADRVEAAIIAHQSHGDHGRVAHEAAVICAELLKFAAYVLGDLAGSGRTLDDAPALRDHLAGSGGWYSPYHDRLREALDKLAQNFGRWERLEDFHETGEIAIDLMRDLGVSLRKVDETNCYVEVNWPSPTLLIAFAAR